MAKVDVDVTEINFSLLHAVIGTGLREPDQRVLVYDATVVEDILDSVSSGLSVEALANILAKKPSKSGNRAPLFIWLNDEIRNELIREAAGSRGIDKLH
jgi:hypothetical protein